MARFPDHVVFADSGITIPIPGGNPATDRGSPGIIIRSLVSVHDASQDGGVDTVSGSFGDGRDFIYRVNDPFDVLYDVLIGTNDYFAIRAYFDEQRLNPEAQRSAGVWNVPVPLQKEFPSIYADGYVPRGVFRHAGRTDVVVRPVELPGYGDPFGIPLDAQRNEQGLAIKYQMVRKEIVKFVVKRAVFAF